MHPLFHRDLMLARTAEASRAATARRYPAEPTRRRRIVARRPRPDVRAGAAPLPADADIRIRYARADDAGALRRLAELDNSRVPEPPLLIAEMCGEPWAARSLVTGAAVATPFEPTAHLTELLALRADQLRAARAALGGGDSTGATVTASEAPAR